VSAVAVVESSWVELAACRGRPTSIWFSTRPFEQHAARTICRSCPVRARCLAEALAEETGEAFSFGVRGGLSAAERRTLLDRPHMP
jgi:WhiB family redox-sensing transcriptional regulator